MADRAERRVKSSRPRVIICAGGGGVGKTTASSALALALARAGHQTLIVTIDPARRLADAMGVAIDGSAQRVRLPGAEDRLLALMPDPSCAMRQFIEHLFVEEPSARARLLDNRLYKVLESSVPGIHELVCMAMVARAATDYRLGAIVIDTAPSRHAIDFVTYPRRLAKLLGGRAVAWLGGLAGGRSKGLFAWGRRRAERALAMVLGEQAVGDVAELFVEMALVRQRFADLSARASELLLSRNAHYLLVAAPTGAAEEDVRYLLDRLATLKLTPKALLINGAYDAPPPWQALLDSEARLPAALRSALAGLEQARLSRDEASRAIRASFARTHARLPQILLPHLLSAEPHAVMLELADHLADQPAKLM